MIIAEAAIFAPLDDFVSHTWSQVILHFLYSIMCFPFQAFITVCFYSSKSLYVQIKHIYCYETDGFNYHLVGSNLLDLMVQHCTCNFSKLKKQEDLEVLWFTIIFSSFQNCTSDTVDDILYQNFCLWTNPCLFNYVLQHLSIRKIPMSLVARIIIRHVLWCNYQQYTLISIQRIRESKEIMPVARKHCQRYFLIGGTEKKQERIQQAASTCWINITPAATTIAKIKIPMSSAQFSVWLQPYSNVSLF